MQAFLGEIWPDELGSAWRNACLDIQQQMHAVAKKVLQGLSLALDREVDFFDQVRFCAVFAVTMTLRPFADAFCLMLSSTWILTQSRILGKTAK